MMFACKFGQNPGLKLRVRTNFFSYFSTKAYVVGTQKNRLDETSQTQKNHLISFEHPKHMFWLRNKKKNWYTLLTKVLLSKKIFTILRSKIVFI